MITVVSLGVCAVMRLGMMCLIAYPRWGFWGVLLCVECVVVGLAGLLSALCPFFRCCVVSLWSLRCGRYVLCRCDLWLIAVLLTQVLPVRSL